MPEKNDFWNLGFLIFSAIGAWVSIKRLQKDFPKLDVFGEANKELANDGFSAIVNLPYYLSYNVPSTRNAVNPLPNLTNSDMSLSGTTPFSENNS